MKGATPEYAMMNGEVEQGDSLETWAASLADAAKAYKGVSGQQSLLLRNKMTDAAKQIINAVRDPGETPFEYSVQVRETLHARVVLSAYRPLDGGNGRSSYDDGAQSLRQDSSARDHILQRCGSKCWC
jgi:hypothetical protein